MTNYPTGTLNDPKAPWNATSIDEFLCPNCGHDLPPDSWEDEWDDVETADGRFHTAHYLATRCKNCGEVTRS